MDILNPAAGLWAVVYLLAAFAGMMAMENRHSEGRGLTHQLGTLMLFAGFAIASFMALMAAEAMTMEPDWLTATRRLPPVANGVLHMVIVALLVVGAYDLWQWARRVLHRRSARKTGARAV